MASLRSMILSGRTQRANHGPPEMRAWYAWNASTVEKALRSRDTVLVNITSVAHDIQAANRGEGADWNKLADLAAIPCPKPPFTQMWLEATYDPLNLGFLVTRIEHEQPWLQETSGFKDLPADIRGRLATIVIAAAWLNLKGNPVLIGEMRYGLDKDGTVILTRDKCMDPEVSDQDINRFRVIQLWVFHAFSRLNCHNVKLVPMTAGAAKPNSKRPPSSVWHEIVVTGLPELRREQKGDVAPDGEKREVRFHKVRGHYADYTKGKGLFGRLKVRLWIEEHTAGNPELGTVVGSYKV